MARSGRALFVAAAVAVSNAGDVTKTNTQCLLYNGNGCSKITDETLCMNSRDGEPNEGDGSVDVRAEPCVWCGGEPCSEGGPLCRGLEQALVEDHPSHWTTANCIDGRTVKESMSRVTVPPPMTTLTAADFEGVNGGEDQACRGETMGDGDEGNGMWAYTMWSATSLEQCMSYCADDCSGVEFKAEDDYCEVWKEQVVESIGKEGFQCYRKKDLSNFKPMAKAEDAAAGPTEPPLGATAAPAEEKAESTEAPKEEAAAPEDAKGTKDADVGEWPAPTEAPVDSPVGGRFVKAQLAGGEYGQVYWVDESGKHALPAGVHCAECGCDGENVEVLPEADVEKMTLADEFHCMATARAAMVGSAAAADDPHFVIVDEGAAKGGKPVTKEIYWKDKAGVYYPIPNSDDCKECGCNDSPMRVPNTTIATATTLGKIGANFTCDMVQMPVAGAAAPAQNPHTIYFILAGIALGVALITAIACVCMRPGSKREKKSKRGIKKLAKPEADEEQASESPLLAPEPAQQILVAPPVYVQSYQQAPQMVYQQPMSFEAFDTNHDGVISREEWMQHVARGPATEPVVAMPPTEPMFMQQMP